MTSCDVRIIRDSEGDRVAYWTEVYETMSNDWLHMTGCFPSEDEAIADARKWVADHNGIVRRISHGVPDLNED